MQSAGRHVGSQVNMEHREAAGRSNTVEENVTNSTMAQKLEPSLEPWGLKCGAKEHPVTGAKAKKSQGQASGESW